QLWLPYSLIEIAFRNRMDSVISEAHPTGPHWLLKEPPATEVLHAPTIECPPSFASLRGDGSTLDPIRDAATAAVHHLQRDEITRDDLIAHLTLGFWVNRAPESLETDPGMHVYQLMASRFSD